MKKGTGKKDAGRLVKLVMTQQIDQAVDIQVCAE